MSIVGKKIDKEMQFNLDGQKIEDDIKPIKFAAVPQPKLVTKTQKQTENKPQTTKGKKDTKKDTKKKTLKNITNQQKQYKKPISSKTPIKKSQSESIQQQSVQKESTHPSRSPSSGSSTPKKRHISQNQPINYREPRQFKSISEQFPNLYGQRRTPQKSPQKSPQHSPKNSKSASRTSMTDMSMDEIDERRQLPKPERNPQVERNVDKLVDKNNKKYYQLKEQEHKRAEERRINLLKQRELMKQYGKSQIIRAHTINECFEQKYAWGANQKRMNEQNRPKESEKKEIDKNAQQQQQNQINIEELFPESQGKRSRYRDIWDKEAKNAVNKKEYSLSAKKKERSVSPRRETERPQRDPKFKQNFEKNAKDILQKMKKEKLAKKSSREAMKAKQNDLEYKAKWYLAHTKKRTFQPTRSFSIGTNLVGVQEMFEDAELDFERKQDNVDEHQKKIKNGQVLTKREVEQFQKDQKIKKEKVNTLKSNLKKERNNIKLKNPEPLTEDEQKIKKLAKTVPKTVIQQPPLQAFILAEADLPPLNEEQYQVEQGMGFREQVEQEIKEQILKQKQKRTPAQQNIQIKPKFEQPKKPQKREKPVYRSQSKVKRVPEYNVFHDFGEVGMLEEDMYNAMHSNWKPEKLRDLSSNSSDQEDEQNFVEQSGFYRNIKINNNKNNKNNKNNQNNNKSGYSNSVQPKKKVYFRDQDEEGEYLTEQKQKLMKIVEQQKRRGMSSDDDQDSDTAYAMQYTTQIWLPTDPVRRDIFIMSSKELMDLDHIQI